MKYQPAERKQRLVRVGDVYTDNDPRNKPHTIAPMEYSCERQRILCLRISGGVERQVHIDPYRLTSGTSRGYKLVTRGMGAILWQRNS